MELKKKLAVILTSLTIMTQASACTSKQTEFETIRGTRDLFDYDTYLRKKGLNMSNLTAEAIDETVYIYEKKYELYSATPETTIEEILNQYYIEDYELRRIQTIKETRNFREGEKIKVYKNTTYTFSLDELDNISKWEYHVVQPGETLEDIKNEYNISIESLKRNNNIINENEIQAYQTIRIPKELAKKKY